MGKIASIANLREGKASCRKQKLDKAYSRKGKNPRSRSNSKNDAHRQEATQNSTPPVISGKISLRSETTKITAEFPRLWFSLLQMNRVPPRFFAGKGDSNAINLFLRGAF